jgi:cytoskeletal protein RodZ
MEKNIHNDPMDDFVKKSFEEYAENPSENMWDRIEVDLLPTENHKPLWYAWRNYRWQLAAAAVILLLVSRLMCVQYYYEAKLRSISGEKEQAAQQATPMPALDPKTVATAKDPANTTSQSTQEIPASTATTAKQPAPASSQINPKTNKSTASTERLEKPEIALSNQPTVTRIAQVTTAVPAIPPHETLAVVPPAPVDGEPSPLKPLDLPLLDQRAVQLSFTQNNQPSQIAVPTKRHQEASGWYADYPSRPT